MSKDKKNKKAILIVHFKGFNLIKLVYGQDILENMIQKKTDHLKNYNENGQQLFHYAEDTFCIYIGNYKDQAYLVEMMKEILVDSIGHLKNNEVSKMVRVNIGALDLSKDPIASTEIFRLIDLITNKIQEQEQGNCGLFDGSMREELMFKESVEKELRKSASENFKDFHLKYQPQVDLKKGKIVGLEVLTRWENKAMGDIPPDIFIHVAEKFQMIDQLGEWVTRSACQFLKTLEIMDVKGIKVAINISIIQLLQEDFIQSLMEIIREENVEPTSLEIEITESSFAENIDIINDKLKILRDLGMTISLDDFGTGYSSLSRLRNLNIDVLKIDKSFIDNINETGDEEVFVNSMIALANELKLKTIAEGVETTVQKEYLMTKDCDIMQGYLFSKPVLSDQVIRLIESQMQKI